MKRKKLTVKACVCGVSRATFKVTYWAVLKQVAWVLLYLVVLYSDIKTLSNGGRLAHGAGAFFAATVLMPVLSYFTYKSARKLHHSVWCSLRASAAAFEDQLRLDKALQPQRKRN